jgi:hypothetical protein
MTQPDPTATLGLFDESTSATRRATQCGGKRRCAFTAWTTRSGIGRTTACGAAPARANAG